MSYKKIWTNSRLHQAMCRCRTSNAAGSCHSHSDKRELINRQFNPFLQIGTTHRRVTQVTKAKILACLKLVSPVAKRYTLSAPALKKQPVLIRQILPPLAVSANLPRSPCPRCQKGYHWVKDCKSRFHKNGTLLVSDQQLGNGLRGQPQAPTTTGAMTLNLFISCIPSLMSSVQPHAVQDWTSVPPPQQY